ncbi:MAG TPA: sensor histidine kinase [Pseudonocardia sp.]|nr:sensor histidine kinase [Pseudonocardia sp.]
MRSRWWSGLPADLVLAAASAAVMLVAAAESTDLPARPVDATVVLFVAGIAAWAALARRAPRVALAGACATFFAALAAGIPAFSPALALGVPLFVAALAGHPWWGAGVIAVVATAGLGYRPFGAGAEPLGQVALDVLFDVALMTVVLLLGETTRSRRALRAESELRLRLAEQEHRERVVAERLRTARDLHDVLAHTVTVVGIQAGVALEALDERPDRAREALERVRTAGRDALSDLRSTIAVLRDPAADRADSADSTDSADRTDGMGRTARTVRADGSPHGPAPGFDRLPELVDAVRAAGVAATLDVRGEEVPVRQAIEVAVYRIVQESLTNALRHADATALTVVLDRGPGRVAVEVRDDGRAHAAGEPERGSGVRGMTERVAALGGELRVGPAGDGAPGWSVRAWFPVEGARCP